MQHSFTIGDFLRLIMKHILIIILCAVVLGGALGGYAKLKQSTTYTAKREMVISHNVDKLPVKDKNSRVLADMQMMSTYAKVADDQLVYKNAHKILKDKYHLKISTENIRSAIKIESEPQTLIMSVEATSSKENHATKIVNATATAIKNKLPKLISNTGKISVLSPATKSDTKSVTGPSAKKYALLGIAAGIFIGLVYVLGKYTILDKNDD